MFDHGWIGLLPRQHLLEEFCRLADALVHFEQANQFTESDLEAAGGEIEIDVFFVQQIDERERHSEDLLDSARKAVIQLRQQPWQLKISRRDQATKPLS